MPGGVSSPVRSFASVGGTPFFVKKGRGATVIDADGNRYVDWVMSYGPLVFGHAHGPILSAVRRALPRGTSYGAPTRGEVELAERVTKAFPSMEKVRFVSSGTEATMSAVRLARGATGRDLVLKFAGCYHGHADSFLVSAGSGVATLGIPGSPGVPASLAGLTLTARYNDLASVEALFAAHPKRIAVIAVEPVAANMGVVAPAPGFLEGLRAIANREGALLLFDEVITGFRVAKGGAQELYGVRGGPHVPRQDPRGRAARRRVRRPRGPHGEDRAGRPRLPGRDALGKPARDGGREGDARFPHARGLREAREGREGARARDERRREEGSASRTAS